MVNKNFLQGFLIGVIEGEGSVSNNRVISIVNTDEDLVKNIEFALNELDIKYYKGLHHKEEYGIKKGVKRAWRFFITSRWDLEKIYNIYSIDSEKKNKLKNILNSYKRKYYRRRENRLDTRS